MSLKQMWKPGLHRVMPMFYLQYIKGHSEARTQVFSVLVPWSFHLLLSLPQLREQNHEVSTAVFCTDLECHVLLGEEIVENV